MTGEEMERAIEFLINHHATVSSDIEGLKEAQKSTAANIESLAKTVVGLADSVSRLEAQAEADRRDMRETFDSVAEEMRDGFNKLILSNEITRDLCNQVARLAVSASQRVTVLEDTNR
jgi:predicted  nucleic acid-binding Zn-ribbon protein